MGTRRLNQALVHALLLAVAACGAQTPEDLLLSAQAAIASGEIRTAEIHLKNLLQRDPNSATARAMLGEVLLASGDPAGAENSLRRALDLGTDRTAVHVPLLRALAAQLKFAAVLEEIAIGPRLTGALEVEALRLEGAAHRGLGAHDAAEAAYRAALRINPSSAPVRTELGALLLESGRAPEARVLVDEVLAQQTDFPPALLLKGTLELASGNTAAAEVALQRIIDLAPVGLEGQSPVAQAALALLIETQLTQGRVEAASANAEKLLAASPRNPTGRTLKAAVEAQENALDDAERRLEAVIADFPEYWPAHRLLGSINVRQNQPEQAGAYLRSAVANNPTDNLARLELAELYIRAGDVDAARALMQTSPRALSDGEFLAFVGGASRKAGLGEQAERYFEESEQQVPADLRQLAGLSDIYLASGEFERAARLLQSTSFENPNAEALRNYLLALVQVRQGEYSAASQTAAKLRADHPAAAWALNLQATTALLERNFDIAGEFLARALEIEPQNVETLLNSARVAMAKNDASGADRYLRLVTEINPGEPTALLGLAQLAGVRGNFREADDWLARAPESPARQEIQGELLAAQGRFDEATDVLLRAYSAQPSVALAVRVYDAARRAERSEPEATLLGWVAEHPEDALANFMLGSIALERGDNDSAIRRYEVVIQAVPTQAVALNNLAWLYGERGDARAIEFGERARAADPSNPAVADTLGWLYVRHSDATRGLPLLEEAAAALAEQADVQYHWAIALAETGDSSRARAVLESLLASGVSFPERDEAERRVMALPDSPRQ